MVIISEFGFPGIFAKNPTEADAQRVSIIREQLPLLAKRDWIAGAILWCYQDYKSRRYFWPGQEQVTSNTASSIRTASASPRTSRGRSSTSRRTSRLGGAGCATMRPVLQISIAPNNASQLPPFLYADSSPRGNWSTTGTESRERRAAVERWWRGLRCGTLTARPPKPIRLLVQLLRPDVAAAAVLELVSP